MGVSYGLIRLLSLINEQKTLSISCRFAPAANPVSGMRGNFRPIFFS